MRLGVETGTARIGIGGSCRSLRRLRCSGFGPLRSLVRSRPTGEGPGIGILRGPRHTKIPSVRGRPQMAWAHCSQRATPQSAASGTASGQPGGSSAHGSSKPGLWTVAVEPWATYRWVVPNTFWHNHEYHSEVVLQFGCEAELIHRIQLFRVAMAVSGSARGSTWFTAAPSKKT